MGTINWFLREGRYGFELYNDGELLLSGQLYASKTEMLNGLAAAQRYATDRRFFHSEKMPGGTFTFVLLSSVGEVLGRSTHYASRDELERGIRQVMAAAPIAWVKEVSAGNAAQVRN